MDGISAKVTKTAGAARPPGPATVPADALSPAIDAVLREVRRRIRSFVVWQGVLVTVVWLGATWWIALALDRLPVEAGWPEMSFTPRLVLLILIGGGAGWLLVRNALSRLLVPLRKESLALLLERRFPQLDDALATLVQQGEESTSTWRDNLQATTCERLARISIADLFNYHALRRTALAAGLLATSILLLGILHPQMLSTGARRLYALDAQRWPRECYIEVAGLRVRGARSVAVISTASSIRSFEDSRIEVAAGDSVSIIARAELPHIGNDRRRLPRLCTLYWTSDSGSRGSLVMNPAGVARDGFQSYVADGEALDALDGDLRFHIRGDDASIGPFVILTVPAPVLTDVSLELIYPRYLSDAASSRWTPRTVSLTSGLRIPAGTRATVVAEASRPLDSAFVVEGEEDLVATVEAIANQPRRFLLELGEVTEDVNLNVWLRDRAGVLSRSPSPIIVGVIEDEPPDVRFRLSGIGTAITPNVRIPVEGRISDDYEVKSTWLAIETPAIDLSAPVSVSSEGVISGAVDFLDLRREGTLANELPTGGGSQIQLTVKADDYCDDPDRSHTGSGEQYTLDVVTPAELLRILERLEADQRRRLEQILGELVEARDNIARSMTRGDDGAIESRENQSREDWQVRQLFVQRSLLQAEKSKQEISAVALAFDEIRGQLVNNRIDAEDRRTRIDQRIVAPLRHIADESLATLETRLKAVDELYRKGSAPQAAPEIGEASRAALVEAEEVLAELQAVLGSLLKFETQNELLEVVRRLLQRQEEVTRRTGAVREQAAFNDIFSGDGDGSGTQPGNLGESILDDQSGLEEEYRLLEEKLFSLYQYEQDENPDRARLLQDAYQQSREKLTLGHFQTAVRMLRESRLREAEKSQETAVEHLRQLLELLQSEDRDKRIRDDLERYRDWLREVDRILRVQQGLRGRTENSQDATPDTARELGDQQDDLARRAGDLQGQMDEEQQPPGGELPAGNADDGAPQSPAPAGPDSANTPANDPLQKAVEKMQEAREALKQARTGEAVDEMREAERQLARAREELEKTLRQLREEEIERALVSLESRFRKMLEAQIGIHEKTQGLGDPARGGREPELEIQSGQLSARERELVGDCDRALLVLEDDGSSVATIETVRQIRLDLVQIADRLAAFQVGGETLQIQTDVIETLGFLVESFEQAQRDDAGERESGEGSGEEPPGQAALLNQLAELKLIRGLQSRILARHRVLAQRLANPADPTGYNEDPEVVRALRQLGQRQVKLQEVTRDIVAEQQRQSGPPGN